MQKRLLKLSLFISLLLNLFYYSLAEASTVVLIHGLDSDRSTWYRHHTVEALFASGWTDATGTFFTPPSQTKKFAPKPKKAFFTVNLPWHEPIETQSKILRDALNFIYQQRQEPLILVGHSAGGIVARFYLLTPNTVPVKGLITIASPHLGSPWADMAWRTLQSPMGDFFDMMGANKWADAVTLLWELSVTPKTNLIHWMNRQPHPFGIRYISIVHRMRANRMKMDFFVPTASQNMNNVPPLRGRSEAYPLYANHELSRQDGLLLAWLLASFK